MAQLAQEMYQYVGDEVAKLVEELAALSTDLQDIQKNQMSEDLAIGSQVQAVDVAHRLYVDQAVTTTRTSLQAEISGKTVMIKTRF